MQAIPYAEAVARKFRLELAPTLLAQREAVTPIAFTRLRSEGPFRGRTMATPPEEAFSFHVALAPMQAGEVWIDGQYSKLPAASVGDTFVFNLAANTIARLNPPYDFLRFYMSSATLDQLAFDGGRRRVGGLRTTSVGAQDPVMRGLALATLPVLEEPKMGTTLFSMRSRWRFTVMSCTTMAARREAAVPFAWGSRPGSFGGPTHISKLISTATPRSRTSPRNVACPPAISPAVFARQQGCRRIDGS
jgi:hypothetical protein